MESLQTRIVLRKMVAYDVFTFVAIYTSAIGLVARGQDDCADVETGLKPILDPCTRSVAECVTAQNLKALGAIFCLPKAEMQFNNFNKCTSRNFSDQLFGALCGGSDCSGTGGACVAGDILCYQIVDRNNATKVFEECNCASPSPDQQCPSVSCKESLEELVEDVGCCTNSLLYAFFLNECKVNSPGSTLFTQDGLARLFVACNVTYPSACRHPFSLDNKTNSATALFKQGFVPVTVFNIIFIYLLNL